MGLRLKANLADYQKKILACYETFDDILSEIRFIRDRLPTESQEYSPEEESFIFNRAFERLLQITFDGVIELGSLYMVDTKGNYDDPEPSAVEVLDLFQELIGNEIANEFKDTYRQERNQLAHELDHFYGSYDLDFVDELLGTTESLLKNLCKATICPKCSGVIKAEKEVKRCSIIYCHECRTFSKVISIHPLIPRAIEDKEEPVEWNVAYGSCPTPYLCKLIKIDKLSSLEISGFQQFLLLYPGHNSEKIFEALLKKHAPYNTSLVRKKYSDLQDNRIKPNNGAFLAVFLEVTNDSNNEDYFDGTTIFKLKDIHGNILDSEGSEGDFSLGCDTFVNLTPVKPGESVIYPVVFDIPEHLINGFEIIPSPT